MQKISSRYTHPQPEVIRFDSNGPARLVIDEHEIPYIDLVDVTSRWEGYHPKPPDGPEAKRIAAAIAEGQRVFNLTCDNRFAITATEDEIWRWSFFLAEAMAVSAGYTSHGRNSRRINRHGISL